MLIVSSKQNYQVKNLGYQIDLCNTLGIPSLIFSNIRDLIYQLSFLNWVKRKSLRCIWTCLVHDNKFNQII